MNSIGLEINQTLDLEFRYVNQKPNIVQTKCRLYIHTTIHKEAHVTITIELSLMFVIINKNTSN